MPQVSKSKSPRSKCIRIMEWTSVRNFPKGTKPTSGSPGRILFGFKKPGGLSIYVCRRNMTYGVFQRWLDSPSKGKYFNSFVKGRY